MKNSKAHIDSNLWTGKKAWQGAITNLSADFNDKVGTYIKGKGIYAGVIDKIEYGTCNMKQTVGPFHLFAARSDLEIGKDWIGKPEYHSLFFTMGKVNSLRSYDETDYDGFPHYEILGVRNFEVELVRSLMCYQDSNKGTWFIPTPDILDRLYELKDTGAFANSFTTEFNEAHKGHTYLTCRADRGTKFFEPTVINTQVKNFANGGLDERCDKDRLAHSVRLVRVEPAQGCAYNFCDTHVLDVSKGRSPF